MCDGAHRAAAFVFSQRSSSCNGGMVSYMCGSSSDQTMPHEGLWGAVTEMVRVGVNTKSTTVSNISGCNSWLSNCSRGPRRPLGPCADDTDPVEHSPLGIKESMSFAEPNSLVVDGAGRGHQVINGRQLRCDVYEGHGATHTFHSVECCGEEELFRRNILFLQQPESAFDGIGGGQHVLAVEERAMTKLFETVVGRNEKCSARLGRRGDSPVLSTA